MCDTLNKEEQKLWAARGFSIKEVIRYARWLEERYYEAVRTGKIK
jgi:hypothetical protein